MSDTVSKPTDRTNWVIEVQEDPETGDKILEFPDDLMASAGWVEGDILEWIDNKNGSWLLRKKDDNTEQDATSS